jgi:hypothetical protein
VLLRIDFALAVVFAQAITPVGVGSRSMQANATREVLGARYTQEKCAGVGKKWAKIIGWQSPGFRTGRWVRFASSIVHRYRNTPAWQRRSR